MKSESGLLSLTSVINSTQSGAATIVLHSLPIWTYLKSSLFQERRNQIHHQWPILLQLGSGHKCWRSWRCPFCVNQGVLRLDGNPYQGTGARTGRATPASLARASPSKSPPVMAGL